MFNNLRCTFKEIYLLAKERRLEEELTYKDDEAYDLADFDIADLEYSEKEKALFNLLESLDFESVKIVQTIMYIGRDHDYSKSDTYEVRYRKYRESLDLNGWNEKEIEINQIVQKVPLDTYLKDGFEILGINI